MHSFTFLKVLLFICFNIPVMAGDVGSTGQTQSDGAMLLNDSPSVRFNSLIESHYSRCKTVFTGNGCKGKSVPKGSNCGWQNVEQQYMAAMGLNFLRQSCRCAESPVKQFMVSSDIGANTDVLSLTHLRQVPTNLEGEGKQLVRLYSTLFTLGHRESSGNFNQGKDGTAKWFSDEGERRQWEAGVFQASTNSLALDGHNGSKNMPGQNPLPKKVFVNYLSQLFSASPTERALGCDLNILGGSKASKSSDVRGAKLNGLFQGKGFCAKVMSTAWGKNPDSPELAIDSNDSSTIDCFRSLQQNCPAFSIEYTAVVSRINRSHWGPLRRHDELKDPRFHRPYPIPACHRFFEDLYQRKDEFCALTAFRNEGVPVNSADIPHPDPGIPSGNAPIQDPGVSGGTGAKQDPGASAPIVDPYPKAPTKAVDGEQPVDPSQYLNNPNAHVVSALRSIPNGGTFSLNSKETMSDMVSALRFDEASGRLQLNTTGLDHGNCSTGTILGFGGALAADQKQNNWKLSREAGLAVLPKGEADGVGFWGRWNANGPGVARIFKDLKLGKNFIDSSINSVPGAISDAPRMGDFVKLFWDKSQGVGKNEKGHMAVFSRYMRGPNGEIQEICFWSASDDSGSTNQFKGGFGEKCVPRQKVQYALFSRLENPKNIEAVTTLPEKDTFLADMLKKEVSFEDALRASGVLN